MSGNKAIAVILDGLRYDAACRYMGFMEHLVETGQAARYKVRSELPSMSRPLYEVLLTGTPSHVNGITANHIVRTSKEKSLFHLTKEHGLTNAAVSYYWVSELYHRAPFQWLTDREINDPRQPIQHGCFYFEDSYPDTHVLADGERLRRVHHPDFLYLHTMGVDDAGHRYGGDSNEYVQAVLKVDAALSALLPLWMAKGYHIVVTADHGMSDRGIHGGTGDEERMVPLYAISPDIVPGIYEDVAVPQLAFAPLICRLLRINPSAKMITYDWPGMRPCCTV